MSVFISVNTLQYWALHSVQCCVSCVQDAVLKQHTERLANAVDMARTLQRNEETLLKDKVETVRVFCVLLPLYTIVRVMGSYCTKGVSHTASG